MASRDGVLDNLTLTINGQAIGGFAFGGNSNSTTAVYFKSSINASNNGQVAQCHYHDGSHTVSSNHLTIYVNDGITSKKSM